MKIRIINLKNFEKIIFSLNFIIQDMLILDCILQRLLKIKNILINFFILLI